MNNKMISKFTNVYELSKTLRFELKPIGNTQKMLEENKVIEKDELIQKKYQETKKYFDRLHREFVLKSLSDYKMEDRADYEEIYRIFKGDNSKKKELQKTEKILRKNIKDQFNKTAKQYKKDYPFLKKNTVDFLFSEEVFRILDEKYRNEDGASTIDPVTGELVSIFDEWKGFTGYFLKFHETRKNFYKDDGTTTAIATRIIDQNLKRFADNLLIYKDKISLLDIDLSEIEDNYDTTLETFFDIEFYSHCLVQEGIDQYNTILGGETKENGEKVKGINEMINQYRQTHKGEKIPFLKSLDKQILSEKEAFIDEIESDEELHNLLQTFQKKAHLRVNILEKLFTDFVDNNDEYDLSEVYITREAFNTISRRWTAQTKIFEENLFDAMKTDKIAGLSYKKNEDVYKFPDFIALSYIKSALEVMPHTDKIWKERYYDELKQNEEPLMWSQFLQIYKMEFDQLLKRNINDNDSGEQVIVGYEESTRKLSELLADFSVTKESKIIIKNHADDVLRIYQMAKYFAVEKKRGWCTEYELDIFYTRPKTGYLAFYEDAYEDIVQAYNKIRNYLTKKPFSEMKWKLNFENSTLASGWDKNKESDNSAIILRRNDKYYLGLMKKGHNKLFDDRYADDIVDGAIDGKYEKVVYKFFPDQAKMMPKVCFSKKGIEFFKPSSEIMEIYKKGEFKKGDHFSVKKMQKLIDFYKECLQTYEGWKGYSFDHIKNTEDYTENISEFYHDVGQDGYKITVIDVSEKYITEKNESGELYLFNIHNKDWNTKDGKAKTGTKNLHTMYFESLFSDENKNANFPMKMNGGAEIFFRPKTSKEKLGLKKDTKGKEVVDHKRYSEDKIFFHLPMTMNRGTGIRYRFNAEVNDFLAKNKDINIIGVDRGEKHLAYYSVIDQDQKILESDTLNVVNDIDYAQKLENRAKDRERSRKNWNEIEQIKDLKKGYISQVVRKLADLIIQYNAIVVFEDLNMRFKQIRGGIEKSAYQQLEKALIEKLNFLVNKNEMNPERAGYLLKACQLTVPIESFKDMGKQTGIIFYTQASYTSKIDPVTGWRPNLYLKYSNAQKAKANIINFSRIAYDGTKDRFEFTYDLSNFGNRDIYPEKTQWKLCSCVERYRWDRKLNENKGGYEHYDELTSEYTKLFEEYKIDVSQDILGQIDVMETKGNEQFFKKFMFLWSLLCQIRNTNSDEATGENDNDFILSPVEPFFDSRDDNDSDLPKNGDDNGAYNIARKGIIILDKISRYATENDGCEKLKWGDLFISHKEWDDFVQK